MAQPTTEITLQVDATGKDVRENEPEKEGCADEGATAKPAQDSVVIEGSDSVETSAGQETTTDAQSNAPTSRPSLVPLGSTHGQSSLPTPPAAPHPKRFSAVNINKKFLEKNTATGSSTITSSTSSSVKVGNPIARPTVQPTSSHPKLVTAKLTAGPIVSSTPAGWSRSPSVAPSPAPATNSPNSTSSLPSTPATQATSTPSQSLHISKVIQPQPRTAATQLKESKPVWGSIKPPPAASLRASDFPTAAEVANVASTRKQAKSEDPKLTPKPPSKQLRSEEADTFRGVHLDPNAHHWDEMEEDDDNFLDGVIEFGDGRQYNVNTSELQAVDSADLQGVRSQGDDKLEPSDPVSKEERFVDDFDRSWPKGSPVSSSKEFSGSNVRSASPKPLPSHSPREYSRVLFNERSNRLEPYSHRQGQGPFGQKRLSINEGNSPESPRSSRDGSHNIQVLRKGPGGDYPRSRRFSASSGGYPSASNGFVGAHREGRHDGPPPSPRSGRDQASPLPEGTFNDRSRRTSMGPPPLPASASQRGPNRQLPPHLSPVGRPRRLSSRDPQLLSPLDAPQSPSFVSTFSGPPQSPVISHASVSPRTASFTSLPGSAADLEEIRKDVMHSAAERAKARRQAEEEQREAQKERARQKAAEIEERIKSEQKDSEEVMKSPSEAEVNAVLEAAVEAVESSQHRQASSKLSENSSTTSHHLRRPSISSRAPIPPSVSAPEAESWRVRQNVPSSPEQIQGCPPVSDLFSASGPSAVEQVASIANSVGDLEVVDFTEMGKFVGFPEPSESQAEVAQASIVVAVLSKPSRRSASDFFDDSNVQPDVSASASKSANFGAWRKQVEVSHEAKNEAVSASKDEPLSETSGAPEESTTKEPLSHLVTHGQTVHVPVHTSPRLPLRPQFKEAPMSALDDTMSRIKGVLVGMHANDTPAVSRGQDPQPRKTTYYLSHTPLRQTAGRWIPPAIRVRDYDDSPDPQEMFPVTILSRPLSPPLEIPVQLPTLSRPLEHVHKKQLMAFNRPPPPARLDILTFDPPIPEMKRTWLLNDVLFRSIAAAYRPTFKYRVIIPKHRGFRPPNPAKLNMVGAFGKPNVADGVSSWRKPVQLVSPLLKHGGSDLGTGLDTTTGSPPPEGKDPENVIASIPKASEASSTKADSNAPVRTRQPKMPEGSAVAFRRDSRIDFVEGSPRPLVNFIVGSELEESWSSQTPMVTELGLTTTSRVVYSPMVSKVELKHEPSKPLSNGSSLLQPGSSKEQVPPPAGDGKVSTDSVTDGLATPPNHQSPWARPSLNLPVKESPSRAPDPEHLKAVWSQPSSKSDVKPVNSLEGIADDLTPLPFVLPDVKSSESPSPSLSSAPSRMSIHEVTKAFQQVPTSAAIQSSRDKAQISPPTTNAPVARPVPAHPTATYPYPPQNNMRPVYAHYPSPMLAHSPAPMIYGHMAPSPVQNRVVNGHPPMYNTWMPPHSSPTMMRSVPPSYPPMVPYPSTGYSQTASTNLMPQPQGPGRPVVMSPVLSPIQPHPYGGSPVLVPTPQNHGYLPMPADRVQPLRTDNMPQHLPSSSHSGFNPGASSPFTRPW